MKHAHPIWVLALIISTIILSCDNNKTSTQKDMGQVTATEASVNTEQAIRAANDSLYAALNAMFTGDVNPINAVWSHSDSITYMGPFGGCSTGWGAVGAEFKKVADLKLGGKITCTNPHVFAGKDMGYVVCVEAGENIDASGKPIIVSHRATNIFHLENGQWKLIHHHTDLSPQLDKAFDTHKK